MYGVTQVCDYTAVTFFARFLMFQTKPWFSNVYEAKNLFMMDSKLVLGCPRHAKNSDFVRDILQKSIFQAIRIWDIVKMTSATLLSRVKAPMSLKKGPQGGVHERWFSPETL